MKVNRGDVLCFSSKKEFKVVVLSVDYHTPLYYVLLPCGTKQYWGALNGLELDKSTILKRVLDE